MKPSIFFRSKKHLAYKIMLLAFCAVVLCGAFCRVISAIYLVIVHAHSFSQKKVVIKKNLPITEKQQITQLQKTIEEYLLEKKKYMRTTIQAYRIIHWYLFLLNAIKNHGILEQISLSKSAITMTIRALQMQNITTYIEAIRSHEDFDTTVLRSCRHEKNKEFLCTLVITPKKNGLKKGVS